RKDLASAQYAIGDRAFVVISGQQVSVHNLSDGKETTSFKLADGFRISASGADVAIESGHVLITGNLGARLLVYKLDGSPVADI
ncbi:hypothetical protein R0J87_22725, partial [Halomonas sp. SIMBA_159]